MSATIGVLATVGVLGAIVAAWGWLRRRGRRALETAAGAVARVEIEARTEAARAAVTDEIRAETEARRARQPSPAEVRATLARIRGRPR